MSLTAAEILILNQSLDRIAAAQITLAGTTTVEYLACSRNYEQTRDTLLRSFQWPWASTRATLARISTLTLDVMPTDSWAVGDTITGITSEATAEILTVTSETEYEIIYLDGTFEAGEVITNATVESVLYEGHPVTYGGDEVVSFDTSDSEQVVCGTGYPTAVDAAPSFEWDYQYYLPADFLRLKKVYEDDGTDEVDDRWEIEGKRILTNYDTCNIKYVRKVTDPTEFEELFAEVLILRMAMKFINPLAKTGSDTLKAELREELRVAESKARLVAAQESNVSGRSDFNLSRYGN
ncbi:MAG: hypothetical protein IMZ61_06570 [Planctomycetes bacterium]|nr:hypothetical protein [Planctomycetota bacterium]